MNRCGTVPARMRRLLFLRNSARMSLSIQHGVINRRPRLILELSCKAGKEPAFNSTAIACLSVAASPALSFSPACESSQPRCGMHQPHARPNPAAAPSGGRGLDPPSVCWMDPMTHARAYCSRNSGEQQLAARRPFIGWTKRAVGEPPRLAMVQFVDTNGQRGGHATPYPALTSLQFGKGTRTSRFTAYGSLAERHGSRKVLRSDCLLQCC